MTRTDIFAADPAININFNFPGMSQLQSIFGSVGGVMVLLCVLGLFVSAGMWAIGSFSDSPMHVSGGKKGVVISLIAAFVIGGGSALVKWFSDRGEEVASPIVGIERVVDEASA